MAKFQRHGERFQSEVRPRVSGQALPGPGMTKFDKKTIPNRDAKAIADYIVKTFK